MGKVHEYCSFNPSDTSITYYGYREDGVRDENYLKKFDDYLIEERSGYRHFGFIHNRLTGERQEIEPTRYIGIWRRGYYMGYSARTFYDFDFNIIYPEYTSQDYSISELSDIIGVDIYSYERISDYSFLLQTKEGYAFYDIDGLGWSSNFYTELYPAGHDVHMCGMNYFTRKDKTVGLYNTAHGEMVPPNYTIVETRILANGTYAYRANNEIFQMTKVSDGYCNWRLASRATAKRSDLSNSTPINHISVRGEELVLSLRTIRPDTHDSYYYTESNYQDASGIYNYVTEKWTVPPNYHTFFPYKDRYIVSKNDHFGHRYTAMQILDKEMKSITSEDYGGHVIYMDKLYAKNSKFETVEINVETGKEVRNLGKLGADGEDFKIWCNHLLIGSINYEDNEREYPNGFDVQAVINALGDPVLVKGWEFHGLIHDGIVMMVKYKMDGNEKARDSRDRYIPESYRVYDLNRKKFLSPEYNSYSIWSDKLTVWMDTNELERSRDPKKLQKYIEIGFANLRTFYTTM